MFTGIIEKTSKIIDITTKKVIVENKFDDLKIGESISVNGVCLTVIEFDFKKIIFNISYETYNRSTFKYIKKSDTVNLERALKLGDRFGGHIVTGHVDDTGVILSIEKKKEWYLFSFGVKDTEFMTEKGSISVDGISLTCYNVKNNSFQTAVIPHTYENTNLKYLSLKSYVNIEFDIIAKYLNKNKSEITYKFLKENGFIS